ncbi:hypothetical protein QLH51_17555 [Sphingomonas sp. 2R-10]|uniref:hypothetical protein n=1 Tax=Sphingomonas sp. 2R-10 TaxID=3045148 RepID=UPI0013DDA87D|nr:hypothetical protein [Sphingomonas sp. 2R-10]MDJ0278601.1 hypothetical protein [Sphingomonas sp. 2R-10]
MHDKQRDSVYDVGVRHMLWTIVAMFTIVWGAPFVFSLVGLRPNLTAVVLIPLGLA